MLQLVLGLEDLSGRRRGAARRRPGDSRTGLFGLLGPNGAGKSTLMRTIATLQAPDAGTITFDGIDVLRDKTALRKRARLPAAGVRRLSAHVAPKACCGISPR